VRAAALYDIHGNLPALEAVLAEIASTGIDSVIIGGDVIPGPMPNETLARLLDLDLPIQFITGNGEIAVIAEMEGRDSGVPLPYRQSIKWNAAQLSSRDRELLKAWPETLSMQITGLGKVLFCHATPQNSNDIFTRLTPSDRLVSMLSGSGADVVICGHTHMQFDRTVDSIRVVNAGSVGMPFGEPGAYWLLVGPEIELRRTEYDLEEAAARIRRTQYPDAEAFAAQNILMSPSEEKMLRLFGQT
jgi:putative phosphoesterase